MTIRAKSADGTIHQFPDGTSKEAIGAAMKRYAEFNKRASTLDEQDLSIARSKNDPFGAFLRKKALAPREGETPEQRETRLYGTRGPTWAEEHPVAAGALTFLQGVPFVGEYADEALAQVAPYINPANRPEETLSTLRGARAEFAKERPVTSTALSLGGAVAGALPALTVAPAATGRTLLTRGLQAAGIGAGIGGVEGAISGFGAGETPENRMAKAMQYGALGVGLGGLVGGVAEPLAAGVRKGVNAVSNVLYNSPRYRALMEAARGREDDVALALEAQARAERGGAMPRTAAEAAAPTGAAEYVALQNKMLGRGESGTELAAKQMQQKEAVTRPLAQAAGLTSAEQAAAVKKSAARKDAADVRQRAADPYYKRADAEYIQLDNRLDNILMRPEVGGAMQAAQQLAQSRGSQGFRQAGQTVSFNGKFLDDMIKELDRTIAANPKTPADRAMNNAIIRSKNDLVDWFTSKSNNYKQGRQVYENLSADPNRMDLAKFLYDKLAPTQKRGGPDVNFDAFVKALQDEPKTVMKALNRASNWTDFSKNLPPSVIADLQKITDEAVNKNATKMLAKAGGTRADEIYEMFTPRDIGPNFLDRLYTLTNMVAKIVGSRMSEADIKKLALEALNPEAAAAALRKAKERGVKAEAVGEAIQQTGRKVSRQAPLAPIAVGAPTQNVMSGRDNRNAMSR
jgi:hypothetical protein